eukprot:634667-Heterocapsa_arctica.AAC.1
MRLLGRDGECTKSGRSQTVLLIGPEIPKSKGPRHRFFIRPIDQERFARNTECPIFVLDHRLTV